MRHNDHPSCIECLAPIEPHEERTVLVGGAAGEERKPAHRHALCEDFANFLAYNFKSGRTLRPGDLLRGWERLRGFYGSVGTRDLPNAYTRGEEFYTAIMRARQKRI